MPQAIAVRILNNKPVVANGNTIVMFLDIGRTQTDTLRRLNTRSNRMRDSIATVMAYERDVIAQSPGLEVDGAKTSAEQLKLVGTSAGGTCESDVVIANKYVSSS